MPIYEYLCTKCGHRFEMIRKFSDPPVTKCPKCKGKVEKQISAPAIQFKGSGWYVNDYGKGNAAGSNKKPEKSSESAYREDSKAQDKPESGSESKPAPKADAKPEGKSESKSESKPSGGVDNENDPISGLGL